jgi:hypothetical protein
MCEKQNVLPIGISEDLKIARVKVYCPRCKDVYSPKKKSADADGAFFGTTFPFLLLMVTPTTRRHTPILNLTSNAKSTSPKYSASNWTPTLKRKNPLSINSQRTPKNSRIRVCWSTTATTRKARSNLNPPKRRTKRNDDRVVTFDGIFREDMRRAEV